jgi:hypothetical protein
LGSESALLRIDQTIPDTSTLLKLAQKGGRAKKPFRYLVLSHYDLQSRTLHYVLTLSCPIRSTCLCTASVPLSGPRYLPTVTITTNGKKLLCVDKPVICRSAPSGGRGMSDEVGFYWNSGWKKEIGTPNKPLPSMDSIKAVYSVAAQPFNLSLTLPPSNLIPVSFLLKRKAQFGLGAESYKYLDSP